MCVRCDPSVATTNNKHAGQGLLLLWPIQVINQPNGAERTRMGTNGSACQWLTATALALTDIHSTLNHPLPDAPLEHSTPNSPSNNGIALGHCLVTISFHIISGDRPAQWTDPRLHPALVLITAQAFPNGSSPNGTRPVNRYLPHPNPHHPQKLPSAWQSRVHSFFSAAS